MSARCPRLVPTDFVKIVQAVLPAIALARDILAINVKMASLVKKKKKLNV